MNNTIAHQALVKFCIDYLEVHHAWVLKVSGGYYQRPGVPDILAALPISRCSGPGASLAVLVAVEVKTGKATLSAAQEREKAALEQAGAVYVIVRTPEDLERRLVEAGLVHQVLQRKQA